MSQYFTVKIDGINITKELIDELLSDYFIKTNYLCQAIIINVEEINYDEKY
jgi:hypothetical protein